MNNLKKVETDLYSVGAGTTAKAKIEISKGEHQLKVILEEDASLEFIATTSNNSSLTLEFVLRGRNSSLEVITCSKAQKTNLQKITTNVAHQASKTRSIVRSRGASWDEGIIELKGLARVEKQAAGSTSFIECKGLLLGEKSKATADPVLEILNNDVECSHAASIKEIDKNQIFYLQTRGLSEEEAKELIVGAFLGEE
jgi:Fe-S cluster assembly scaffold protein SufB